VARATRQSRLGAGGVGVILEINPDAALPPYEQLREQITALVLGGALAPGDRLPAIRQLAKDLGLAGGTVARAYRELESDGVVSTHGRHGTVVAEPPSRATPPPELLDAARSYADRAAHTGATLDDALTAVRVAFAAAATS
jgi:GntR family transcriptional regulator